MQNKDKTPCNSSLSRNLLLTGVSDVGKSTLIKRVAEQFGERKIRGFCSEVIWQGDQRTGWRIDTFDGDSGILAHTGVRSQHNLGRYGVDMALF